MSLKRTTDRNESKVTLQTLAKHLNLAAGTISAALNDSPAARAIPEVPWWAVLMDHGRFSTVVQ